MCGPHHCPGRGTSAPDSETRTHLALKNLFGEALVERTKIDHDSLVGSAADFFYAVACRHLEVDSLPFNVDYLGCRAHVATYRRGGEMSYIYRRADRALTSIQKLPHGIERGRFHDHDHH